MDFRQLKHFVALVEHGSYAKASIAVHLSQSALSRSIQQLEQHLGVTLFERGHFGATLTAHGLASLPQMRGLIAAEESLKQTIESLSDLKSGNLKIGTGPYPAITFVNAVAASFVNQYPDITLTIKTENWVSLREQLLSHQIDLFIADTRELRDDPLLTITELPALVGVLFCRTNHPLIEKTQLTWADLLQYPFAIPKISAQIEQFFQEASQPFGGLTRRIECDNIAMLIDIVMQSNAFSIAPFTVIADGITQGQLTVLDISDMAKIHTAFGVISRQQRQLSPAAEAFKALLLQHIANDSLLQSSIK